MGPVTGLVDRPRKSDSSQGSESWGTIGRGDYRLWLLYLTHLSHLLCCVFVFV